MDTPDWDVLFGVEDSACSGASVAAECGNGLFSGGATTLEPPPKSYSRSHVALLQSVETLAAQTWPVAARELRALSSRAVEVALFPSLSLPIEQQQFHKVSVKPLLAAIADHMDAALAAMRQGEWTACNSNAVVARTMAWDGFISGHGWHRACDKEVFMLAELLSALSAFAVGDAISALRCVDHVFVFSTGIHRDTALLFIHSLDDGARLQRSLVDACSLPVSWAGTPPRWAQRRGFAGAVGVTRVNATNAAEMQLLFEARQPFIAVNLLEKWSARERWKSLAELDAIAGHRLMPVEVGGREELMTLGHFIRTYLLQSLEHCTRSSDLEEEPHYNVDKAYISQHALLDQCPTLRGDVVVPEPWRRAFGEPTHSNVWLGTHGTVTPCHWDEYNNCLAQVQGTKRAFMLAPEASPFLYGNCDSVGGQAALGNLSPVDVEAPNLSKFPKFAEAQLLITELGPGDGLFIPMGWWHQVRALTPSVSVNYWF